MKSSNVVPGSFTLADKGGNLRWALLAICRSGRLGYSKSVFLGLAALAACSLTRYAVLCEVHSPLAHTISFAICQCAIPNGAADARGCCDSVIRMTCNSSIYPGLITMSATGVISQFPEMLCLALYPRVPLVSLISVIYLTSPHKAPSLVVPGHAG